MTTLIALALVAALTPEACGKIDSRDARLSCYDGLFRSTTAASAAGPWSKRVTTNPMDDSKTVTLSNIAEQGRAKFDRPIALVIRCKSSKTELYIRWNDYLGSSAEVTTRVGDSPSRAFTWGLSTDSQATFYPNNHVTFVKMLMEVDQLVAQVTPYNASPLTAIFDVSGLADAVLELRETCGW